MSKAEAQTALAGLPPDGAFMTSLRSARPDLFDKRWWKKVLDRSLRGGGGTAMSMDDFMRQAGG